MQVKFSLNKKPVYYPSMDTMLINFNHEYKLLRKNFSFVDYTNIITDGEYDDYFKFIKSYLEIQENSLIVLIINWNQFNKIQLDRIIRFSKKNKVTKLYFFTLDVFLILAENELQNDVSLIDRCPDTFFLPELDAIKYIIDELKLDYEIYHLEYNPTVLEKKYNLKIKFYDLYTTALISSNTNKFNFVDTFHYKLCSLNRRKDPYRSYIASLLYKFEDVKITLNNRFTLDRLFYNKSFPIDNFSEEIKNNIISGYTDIMTNNIELSWDIPHIPNLHNKEFSTQAEMNHHDSKPLIIDSFLSLITETRFYCNMPSIGEKTINVILCHRPFIIMAAPGTLELLKRLGFKTFDRWWDESYDSIDDHHQRFERIYHIVVDILKKDTAELKSMLSEMKEILEHNKKNLSTLKPKFFELNDPD